MVNVSLDWIGIDIGSNDITEMSESKYLDICNFIKRRYDNIVITVVGKEDGQVCRESDKNIEISDMKY